MISAATGTTSLPSGVDATSEDVLPAKFDSASTRGEVGVFVACVLAARAALHDEILASGLAK